MPNTNKLLQLAFEKYLDRINNAIPEPSCSYLPYNFDFIDKVNWRIPFIESSIQDDLREMTTIINLWHQHLISWNAWRHVVSDYSLEEAWEIRREFMEAKIHQCLLQPSAIRDALTLVSTKSMHQFRLAIDETYKDYIEGDPINIKKRPKHLSRKEKENRLIKLIENFSGATDFIKKLKEINQDNYVNATYDYRNRVSHEIGPRIGIGHINILTRNFREKTKMTKQPGGTYIEEVIAGEVSVCYGFGSIPPIDIEQVFKDNLEQFYLAKNCFESFVSFLTNNINEMTQY